MILEKLDIDSLNKKETVCHLVLLLIRSSLVVFLAVGIYCYFVGSLIELMLKEVASCLCKRQLG
jgi:hypothetical protein